jgi:hypothetical protein
LSGRIVDTPILLAASSFRELGSIAGLGFSGSAVSLNWTDLVGFSASWAEINCSSLERRMSRFPGMTSGLVGGSRIGGQKRSGRWWRKMERDKEEEREIR